MSSLRNRFAVQALAALALVALIAVGCRAARKPSTPLSRARSVAVGWPMSHHDPAHTDCSASRGPLHPVREWSFGGLFGAAGPPVAAADGTVYVGSSGTLYALKPDGTRMWSFKFGGGGFVAPALGSNGIIYLATVTRGLYAVDRRGKKKWHLSVGGTMTPLTIGPDGTVYFGIEGGFHSQPGKIYAVDSSGRKEWSFAAGTGMMAPPAVGPDGTVYAGTVSLGTNLQVGRVVAVASNGKKKWIFDAGSSVVGGPAIANDGTIYFGTLAGRFYALRPDGIQKWVFQSSRPEQFENWYLGTISNPAIGNDGTVYFADDQVHALTPDGKQKWAYGTKGAGLSISGAERLVLRLPGFVREIVADRKGTVYLTGLFGSKLVAIGSDGRRRWELPMERTDMGSAEAIGPDGTLYVSLSTGLVAIGER